MNAETAKVPYIAALMPLRMASFPSVGSTWREASDQGRAQRIFQNVCQFESLFLIKLPGDLAAARFDGRFG